MNKHKWHKEIKAWADGAEIEYWDAVANRWVLIIEMPYWNNDMEYRIKPQPKEEPYWLCCGCKDPRHNKSCLEAKMGHPERCRFGTASEHFKPQPKESQYLYVYKSIPDNYGNGTSEVKIATVKLNNKYYLGKIRLDNDND